MLERATLVDKFGEWSETYADAAIAALLQYGGARTQMSMRRGSNEDEAVLTIKGAPSPDAPHCMLDTALVAELRGEHEAFRRQCIEVVVTPDKRLVEYTFADAHKSTSAQIEAKHFSYAWHPDCQLAATVTPAVAAHRSEMAQNMQQNDRLSRRDKARLTQIVSLYLISSAEVPSFRIYVEEHGTVLVFVGVRKLALSWCMHLIRHDDIGVSRVQVTDGEIRFTLSSALLEPETGGPLRSRGGRGPPPRTSFLGKIRQGITSLW